MPDNTEAVKEAVKEALVEVEATKKKTGYKTTEFWLTAAASIVGLIMASGVIETGSHWDKIIGLGVAALASMGYSASRGRVKAAGK